MKHIITQFLQKQNPGIFLLRFGLSYSGILALLSISFQRQGVALFTSHHQSAELLLIASITAFFQTLIGYGFLFLGTKKSRFK